MKRYMEMMNRHFFSKHLEDDELLQMLVHKHWLVGFSNLFWPTCSFVAVLTLLYFVPLTLMIYITIIACIAIFVWWLRNFFDYYLDAWLITNHGVIDIEWHGWFSRNSTRVLYSDIQGVSYEINGVLNTILSYGTISVEKISTGSTLSMDNVPHPRRVEMAIMKYMEAYLHQNNLKDASQVQQILSQVVAREFQLKHVRSNSVL